MRILYIFFCMKNALVLSRNYFLLVNKIDDSAPMRKLNQQKIRWIIKEIDKGERTTYRIAKTMNITPQWTRELHRQFHTTHQYPYPKKPGRKTKPIPRHRKTNRTRDTQTASPRSSHTRKDPHRTRNPHRPQPNPSDIKTGEHCEKRTT